MNILFILFLSLSTSVIISFLMMKFHMKMIEKWMDQFFNNELEFIKNHLNTSEKESRCYYLNGK